MTSPFDTLPGVTSTWKPTTNARFTGRTTGFWGGGSWGLSQPGTPGSFEKKTPTFLEQLISGAGQDLSAFKTAADAQRGRLNDQIKGMQGLVSGFGKGLEQATNTSLGEMQSLIGNINSTATAQGQAFEGAASDIMNRVNSAADRNWANLANVRSDIQGAYQRADAAVGTSAAAAAAYDIGVNEQAIGATVTGLRERVQQQKQMIAAGLNPDGTMMTQAERMMASRNLEADTSRTISMTAATMREQAQKTLADLKNITAGFQMQSAGVHLQGAGLQLEANREGLMGEQLRAQTGLTVQQQRLESQAGMRQSQQMVAGLTQMMSQLRTASKLTAFQAEFQGRMELFNEIQSNPESIVSLIPTLLMLGQVASAPGGRGMMGFDFGGNQA